MAGEFKKGHKKLGGITKGTKHRSTEIRDYVQCEPIEKVIDLLENGNIKESEKAKIWMEVCKYFYKTPKDNDINLKVNGDVGIKKVFITPQEKKETDSHIDDVINGNA